MKCFTTTMGALLTVGAFAQARLVMNNDAFIVIDNNAKLIVENPSANAVATLGTGGNIITESEFDQVVWNIGTSTGAYVVPFTSLAGLTKIPFTASLSAAGTGAGRIFFSTYPGPNWDNNSYRPTDVTHMYDNNTNSVNNSSHVIDRFWIIDATGYGTRPTASFQFTYRDAEHLQAGNAIIEGNLGGQRFNSASDQWGDYLPQGITNPVANITTGVPVSPANFFRSWTLSEVTNPLASTVAYFQSSCPGNALLLSWETLSETNVSHFEIEHDENAQFVVIGFVQALGGNGVQQYAFQSDVIREGVFRLVEVDNDGNRFVKSLLSASCVATDDAAVSYDGNTNSLLLSFDGAAESIETLQVYDAAGKLVHRRDLQVAAGPNAIVVPGLFLSQGMYMVRMKNGLGQLNEKVVSAD